jgi:hypothetical protein
MPARAAALCLSDITCAGPVRGREFGASSRKYRSRNGLQVLLMERMAYEPNPVFRCITLATGMAYSLFNGMNELQKSVAL